MASGGSWTSLSLALLVLKSEKHSVQASNRRLIFSDFLVPLLGLGKEGDEEGERWPWGAGPDLEALEDVLGAWHS